MIIYGNNVFLRFFAESDAKALLKMRIDNKKFFQKHSPPFDKDYIKIENVKQTIKKYDEQREKGNMYFFGIFEQNTKALVGDISLFQVKRGPLQRCYVGYSIDKKHNGKGYATEAVKLAVGFAFDVLELHRIEAGAMPENIGSMRVLEKAGFLKEGIEREGVNINGIWRDHQVFSILEKDYLDNPIYKTQKETKS